LPSRLRVPFGYAIGALVLLFARPTPRSIALGLPLALLGEAFRIWASGHIDKTRALATGGPYAHTRNPLYVGSGAIALGAALACWSPWVAAAAVGYFLAFYPRLVREEAAFLAGRFPEEYARWSAHVPLFVPRLWPSGPRVSRFAWPQVARNREWRTLFAVPAAFGLLYLRGLWIP
jgi:protein-S-isoprenylcysteine O-methyltransferase Ste14